jgi:hypothetical protein
MELGDLEKVDAGHMFKEYDRWPEFAIESFEKKFDKFDTKDIDHIEVQVQLGIQLVRYYQKKIFTLVMLKAICYQKP